MCAFDIFIASLLCVGEKEGELRFQGAVRSCPGRTSLSSRFPRMSVKGSAGGVCLRLCRSVPTGIKATWHVKSSRFIPCTCTGLERLHFCHFTTSPSISVLKDHGNICRLGRAGKASRSQASRPEGLLSRQQVKVFRLELARVSGGHRTHVYACSRVLCLLFVFKTIPQLGFSCSEEVASSLETSMNLVNC
jgi:hypothetical protein